jgi:hypothetical protein
VSFADSKVPACFDTIYIGEKTIYINSLCSKNYSLLDYRFEGSHIVGMRALAEARKAAGLTQRQLAAVLEIEQGTLADIERGRRPLPRERLVKLPKQIRRPVIDATIAQLRTEIAELRALR